MVPNASCSSLAEFRINTPGEAENQPGARDDFKNAGMNPLLGLPVEKWKSRDREAQ